MSTHAAVTAIIKSLDEVFSPMDAEVLAATKVWAEERMAAVAAFRASDEAKEYLARRDSWGYYDRVFALAGGKSWYQALNGRNQAGREEVVTKNCAAIAAKRNAGIAKKLQAAGVTSVESTTYTRTTDGFDGTFVVLTDAGRKVVTVNTIRAGGYNIQCLHLRVLTKVK
jgi:hypothetical protein